MADQFSTQHLDYIQRIGIEPPSVAITATTPITSCLPEGCSLVRIAGIGRKDKAVTPSLEGSAKLENTQHLPTEDALIGLYGYTFPLAFLVRGDPKGVAIYLGTWTDVGRERASPAVIQDRQNILTSVLHSLYPVLKMAPVHSPYKITEPHWQGISPADIHSGFVLGIPTIKPIDSLDGSLPLDRLIHGLSGSRWAILILAQPVDEQVTSKLRYQIINEIRVQMPSQTTSQISPLVHAYIELLKKMLMTFTQGQSIGIWRTGAYLMGDREGYSRLVSLWRGLFSGERSLPEPIRIWHRSEAAELAARWALLDELAPSGPGYYRHVFQYQTLLTSSQLAAYIHLPNLETSGFPIEMVPDFDVVPPLVKETPILSLGTILHHTRETSIPYRVSAKSLTRHVFVSGITGAGKTNTILHLLKQSQVPFLVLEPAKTEYRVLLHDQHLANRVRIFTLGDETISPFRLNPFEVLPGTSVNTHLDLLRSVFTASFGLWTPLPQILEQCLHHIYMDRGWDLTTNTNTRLDKASQVQDTFPTLSDLVAKVDDVLRNLKYEEKVEGNMRAALLIRLQALRIGGKGAMLDVQRSFPIETLLEQPTILELEGMGDDDDRAFVMGLLLIRIVEFQRAQGQVDSLKHLLVIEEAHRLLANVGERRSQEEANSRGKAVETFANLLSEIRAYGQGIVIADQVPVKLAPDVIKNTNLKIVHRIVAQDDRTVLAGAMAMNEKQAKTLSTLLTGQAVVFSEGDDVPVQVKVPQIKGLDGQAPPSNHHIIKHVAHIRQQIHQLSLPFVECGRTCSSKRDACQVAQQTVATTTFQRSFARVVLSMIEDVSALDHMWDDLVLVARANLPPNSEEKDIMPCLLTRAAHWLAQRRGAQAHWSYAETREFATTLRQVLVDKLTQGSTSPRRTTFQQCVIKLHTRRTNPYPICHQVCQQQPAVCLYRSAVADLVTLGQMNVRWYKAYDKDLAAANNRKQELWEASLDAAYELITFPETGDIHDSQRRVALCFAQQMLVNDAKRIPPTIRKVLQQILKEAQT